jgi:hypothetical protein
MNQSQGAELIQYIHFVVDQGPDNSHTPENINNLKALISSFCELTKTPKPDIYLQMWCGSHGGECENIEIHFDDGSTVKLGEEVAQLFGANEYRPAISDDQGGEL